MDARKAAQLGGLFFGRSVGQKIAAADFRPCKILQEVRLA